MDIPDDQWGFEHYKSGTPKGDGNWYALFAIDADNEDQAIERVTAVLLEEDGEPLDDVKWSATRPLRSWIVKMQWSEN